MDNTFYINEIPIIIAFVTPSEILPEYGEFKNYVKSVAITYQFRFKDITAPTLEEDPNFPEYFQTVVTLKYELKEDDFGNYVEFDDINKELFYPIAINIANESTEIAKQVAFVRNRTGLDPSTPPPKPAILPKPKSFR